MRSRRAVVAGLVLGGLLAGAAVPAMGAGWSRITPDDISIIDEASVLPQPNRVLVAWPVGTANGLAESVGFRGLSPALDRPAAGAGPIATIAAGFTALGDPDLIGTPTGVRAVFPAMRTDGRSFIHLTGPLAEGASPGPAAEIAETRGGSMDADLATGGGPLVAADVAGSLTSFANAVVSTDLASQLQAQLGGCCSYNPALAIDGAGRAWVAWYSNATANTGIYVQQLDPATGAPVGAPAGVPQSASVANNSTRIVLLATGGSVRVFYAAQATPTARLRVASWTPGGPVVIVATPADLTLNAPITASVRADGRVWVAWYDRTLSTATTGIVAKLGDSRGAGGGTPVRLGLPPRTVTSSALRSAVIGPDLWVALVANTGATRAGLWAATAPEVVIPFPQTIRSGPATVTAPKRVAVKDLKRTKCVNVRVAARGPSRVVVSIFSGTKSIRLFGQRRVTFTAAGTKVVCVRVPYNARTFDVRTPFRIGVAAKTGAKPAKGEKPGSLTVRSLRFFS